MLLKCVLVAGSPLLFKKVSWLKQLFPLFIYLKVILQDSFLNLTLCASLWCRRWCSAAPLYLAPIPHVRMWSEVSAISTFILPREQSQHSVAFRFNAAAQCFLSVFSCVHISEDERWTPRETAHPPYPTVKVNLVNLPAVISCYLNYSSYIGPIALKNTWWLILDCMTSHVM